MPSQVSSAPRSRSTAARERRSGKPARSWRWPILAVVLGLFAPQEALAQTTVLTGLSLTDAETDTAIPLDEALNTAADPEQRAFTASVVFGVTQVTVDADVDTAVWSVTYHDAADADLSADDYQRNLVVGANRITVRATSEADPPEPARSYTITVTRAAEIGSALQTLALYEGDAQTTAITLDPPGFLNTRNDLNFTAKVNRTVATATVAAEAKDGWEDDLTYPFQGNTDYPDAHSNPGYQRSLVVGANRITVRATPIGASGTRDYTITVTRTTWPSAPRNLRATPENMTVGLSWTAPSSNGGRFISQYQYRMKDEDQDDYSDWVGIGTASSGPGDDATTSHSVSTIATRDGSGTAGSDPLVNGTTYLFQVRAVNANVILADDGITSNTAEATPARPLPRPEWTLTTDTNTPDPVVVGHRRVTLSWTRIPDATDPTMDDESVTGYDYRRRVEGGSPGGWTTIADRDLVESGTTRSYTVTSLTNGTRYGFQVRGRNSVGGGAESTEIYGTPEAKAPGAPTNLRATAGDEQVTLEWTAPADNGGEPITRYEYRSSETSGSYPADSWITTGGTGTTVTVHGLDNGTTYYFQVRAVNDLDCTQSGRTDGCNEGLASLEVSATPFGRPATRVNLTTATSDEDRQVRLMWTLATPTPPADDRSGFQYRQRAGGGYGSWLDVRNSDADTDTHVVSGLMNGTTYTFQVRAANSSGGGLASNERSAVPSTTPGAPTLTATPGDEEVRLTWTPAASGGRRIIRYECRLRIGAGVYSSDTSTPSGCAGKSIGASATSLTLTDDDDVATGTPLTNGVTYTFQVRAVNDRENELETSLGAADGDGDGDWSNEASARPSDGSERSYTISATIDGKSWARADEASALNATVEVNPRFREPSTKLWVDVDGAGAGTTATGVAEDGSDTTGGTTVEFGPADSRRDASFTVTPTSAGYITIALLSSEDADVGTAMAVTRVEVRPANTPDPPTGLVAARGDGEVTLSWATPTDDQGDPITTYDYEYRQRRQPGSYGRWTEFAGDEFQRSGTVTSNTVTGLTDGGTYAFQVRALNGGAPGDPSDEVTVSLSGTVDTGGLSAPRNFAAAPGNGQVTLSWTAPASDGGAAISGYEYQQRAGTGAYGQWTPIPGGGPTTRSYIVTGLTNGTRYFFRVRAVNSDGPGPPSAEESATPSLNVDTTLRALSLSTATLAPVTVALAPAFSPATRTYTAAVGSTVTQVTVAATPNKAGAAATITPADASTAVAGHQVALAVGPNPIRVRVADGTNTGDYTITVTRAGSVPAAPTGLTATAGGGMVTLSWTAPTGGGAVGGYEYQQKAGTDAYGAWTRIPGSGPSTTSHTVTGLANGTAYAFRVRAVNSTGPGAASNEVTAMPAMERLVWAKTEREVADAITAARNAGYGDDRTFTAGETIEVMGSTLFNAAEGVSLTFATASDDTDVASTAASGGTVTVTARAAGMATITITARASRPSGVTIVEQTDPGEASIRFDVEVGLEALTLELSGPEDWTNLVEGGRVHANGTLGTVTVRARANRPVTEEVTVTLLADRALSEATGDDFAAEPIVIEAGETIGATVVTAVEDNTPEDREGLVLFGVAADNAGAVTGEIRLYLFDAAVPALPVIAQLLLAAFLAIGGYRRYRRR